MWALTKKKPEAGLWMERVPVPEVGPNDVKIKIHKTAICGTDVHIYQWNEWAQHTIPIGLTAGHEYVGEIVEVGSGVDGHTVGAVSYTHLEPGVHFPDGIPHHNSGPYCRPNCTAGFPFQYRKIQAGSAGIPGLSLPRSWQCCSQPPGCSRFSPVPGYHHCQYISDCIPATVPRPAA